MLDDNGQETLEVKQGSTFLAPANVWHDLIDSGDGSLVAQHVTKQPSGMERDKVNLLLLYHSCKRFSYMTDLFTVIVEE